MRVDVHFPCKNILNALHDGGEDFFRCRANETIFCERMQKKSPIKCERGVRNNSKHRRKKFAPWKLVKFLFNAILRSRVNMRFWIYYDNWHGLCFHFTLRGFTSNHLDTEPKPPSLDLSPTFFIHSWRPQVDTASIYISRCSVKKRVK